MIILREPVPLASLKGQHSHHYDTMVKVVVDVVQGNRGMEIQDSGLRQQVESVISRIILR